MSEKAPERIWAAQYAKGQDSGECGVEYEGEGDNEYVRADLVSTQIAQARVEARREALEEAAELLDRYVNTEGYVSELRALIAKETK